MKQDDKIREMFIEELRTKNDPVENWPLAKLRRVLKEEEDDTGENQNLSKDDIGID